MVVAVIVVCVCGVLCCGVWGDTLKTPRVYIQNVSVCTGNTSTCVATCGRGGTATWNQVPVNV